MRPVPLRWLSFVGTALALGVLWVAPVSPAAMSRADVALGQGDPARAARIYDAVGRWCPWRATRVEALRRAAAVHGAELNHPAGARARLEALLREELSPRERADVLAWLGQVHLQERRFARAARVLERAVQMDPDAAEAAQRTAWAARAWDGAGEQGRAERAWRALIEDHPAWRARARLGLAELYLGRRQPERALPLFQQVALDGLPDEQSAAHLGVSVCLEQLGELDRAVAAIDEAELPEDVRRRRAQALRARQAWTN